MNLFLMLIIISKSSFSQTTLDEFYQAAKNNVADIKEKVLQERIADQRKNIARSTVLPKLTASHEERKLDVSGTSSFERDRQRTSSLGLSQSLFQGGSEYYALSIARKLPKIAELDLQQTEIQVYEQIAEAFYAVLRLQNEVDILEEQEKTLTSRVRTLQQRAQIGRNRSTDVLASRSQLARTTAELSLLQRQLVNAKQTLKDRTGVTTINTLIDTLDPLSLQIPLDWEHGLMQSPLIEYSELLLDVSQKEVGVARGKYFPTLSLDADYYLDRSGNSSDSDWMISMNASWELFAGGKNLAEKSIKNLESQIIAARLTDTKRNVVSQFDSLKQEFLLQKDSIKKLSSAVDLAKANYEQHLTEVNRGLVSQLDVLRVLEDYQQIRRSYIQQVYDTKLAWIQLRGLAGVAP